MPSVDEDYIFKEALEVWTHAGLECAMVVSPMGSSMNGYVRLPEGHKDFQFESSNENTVKGMGSILNDPPPEDDGGRWRELQEVSKPIVERAKEKLEDGDRGHNIYYDNIDVDVHGGLTYGPDPYGWVGFDTAHYMDRWDRDVVFPLANPERVKNILEFEAKNPDLMGWPSLATDEYPATWTIERLKNEVNNLAEQLAGRHLELMTAWNKTHGSD